MRRRGVGRGRPSLVRTAATTAVIAGTATAVSGSVAGKQQANAQQAAAAQAPAPPPPPAPPAPPGAGLTDEVFQQLKQLGELRDAGILTEEEFTAKKTTLLGL